MRTWLRLITITAVLAVMGAGELKAQVFTPTYMAPRLSSDMGLYLADGPGEFSVEGILRRGFGGYDLGVRVGLADTEDVTFLIGGELRHPVAQSAPIDLSVTGHVQGAFGDGSAAGFMIGLSGGYTFQAPGISFTPYLHPRVGGIEAGDEFDLELLADLGFDLSFSPSLDIRLGITFTDDAAADFGVGFAWR